MNPTFFSSSYSPLDIGQWPRLGTSEKGVSVSRDTGPSVVGKDGRRGMTPGASPCCAGWLEAQRNEEDSRREPQTPEEICPLHPTDHEWVCHSLSALSAWDALEARVELSKSRDRAARGVAARVVQTWPHGPISCTLVRNRPTHTEYGRL